MTAQATDSTVEKFLSTTEITERCETSFCYLRHQDSKGAALNKRVVSEFVKQRLDNWKFSMPVGMRAVRLMHMATQ